MRVLRIAFTCLSMTLMTGLSVFAEGVRGPARIATENYPPYLFQNPDEPLRGFDYEVGKAAFELMGFDPDIVFLPWKRAVQEAKLGEAIGLLTCAYTKEREEYLWFSDPISKFTNGFYVRSRFNGIEPLEIRDLEGQSVGSVSGYESFKALEKAGFKPVAAKDNATALIMLDSGRFDYLYLSGEAGDFEIAKLGMQDRFRFHPIIIKDFHMGFSKQHPDSENLVEEFNMALKLMKLNGTYDRIHSKYK